MSKFRQAPPDPDKADRDGVTKYIPARHQVDVSFVCKVCPKTATWEITADGEKFHACDSHRKEYAVTANVYEEKRLR